MKKNHYKDETGIVACGADKYSSKEKFEISVVTDITAVTCHTCLSKLGMASKIEIKAPLEKNSSRKNLDINSLVGLHIKEAFLACHNSQFRFVQLVAEDGEQYSVVFHTDRIDRINLEAVNDLVCKVYVR